MRPGGYGGAGGRCVHGVYADGDTGFGKPLDHGQNTPKFLLNTDAHCTGPGGFAAHIDNVCALGDHVPRVGESVVRGVVFAAVAEGIGGDVQDSHHQGSLCGCGVAGQVCGGLRAHHCVHDSILTDAHQPLLPAFSYHARSGYADYLYRHNIRLSRPQRAPNR